MNRDLVKLLSERNSSIIDMQENRPLLIKGYSPLKLYMRGDLRRKILVDIHFYDKKYDKKRTAYDVHLETLSFFTLHSILHKNRISPSGEARIFDIDIKNYKTMRIKNLDTKMQKNINEFVYFSTYEYLNIFESNDSKIVVPSCIIGKFFYYPNSHIKRAFFTQNISSIVEKGLTNCIKGEICFTGTHIKFTKINTILAYLYYCDSLASKYFHNSFSYYFKEEIKKYNDKSMLKNLKNDFMWINPRFVFPLTSALKTPLNILFRIVEIDKNTFLALEILDIDFKNLTGKDEITAFYEGREKVSSVKLNRFQAGKPNKKSISNTQAYNPIYLSLSNVFIEKLPDSIDELLVKKGDAVRRGEKIYKQSIKDSDKKSEGTTLDDTRDRNSKYGKGYVSKFDFDFKKAMKILEKKLKIEGHTKLIDESEHFGFLFNWNQRNYFVLELKNYDAQTLLFSSNRTISYEMITRKILEIKKGIIRKSYKKFKKDIERYSIFFHTPQKHVGEDLEKWVDRLILKMEKYYNFKGM